MIDAGMWAMALDDPEALDAPTWERLCAALAADPTLRERLRREWLLQERLSRLHDAGRGDLWAALRHRLEHQRDQTRFVQRVSRAARHRRPPPSRAPWIGVALAASLLIAIGVALTAHPTRQAVWIDGPAELPLAGGGRVVLDAGARWLDATSPRLERGHADLEVEKHPATPLSIGVPQGQVTVLGTGFTLEVGSECAVAVRHGRVRLTASTGSSVELGSGERGFLAASGAQQELLRFSSAGEATDPAPVLIGERTGGCFASGIYLDSDRPLACVSLGMQTEGLLRAEAGMLVSFRWRADATLGRILLQVWNMDRHLNAVANLGPPDGQWQRARIRLADLRAFDETANPGVVIQPGDLIQGILLVGTNDTGRIHLDEVTISVAR